MIFNYRYSGSTQISSSASGIGMSFAPDTLRQPTFFVGELSKHIPFREAISALHEVVVSDLSFKPKDRPDYQAWLKEQENIWLAEAAAKSQEVSARLDKLKEELTALRHAKSRIMGPFNQAKQRYFKYLYKKERDTWFVLDPVITVHPDKLFFECFSQDESSYGKLSCSYEVFTHISEFECGTTNIDYSSALYQEFQKIRKYKSTQFTIDPSGFEVKTESEDAYREIKIDLPDSWVRGFLQVSSAMTLPSCSFDLHPMDIHNFCWMLKRNKEKQGPRSIIYRLIPGEPVRAIFEPWNREIVCARSIYQGPEKAEIRVWGRRRLLILERLIPITKKVSVFLLGSGLPSFYIADLGDMHFTLGLSGWTANDWSGKGNFDLMMQREEVDAWTKQEVFAALKSDWRANVSDISKKLNITESKVKSALDIYTQAGRVVFDLAQGVFRARELSREPLPIDQLRYESPIEKQAYEWVQAGQVKVKISYGLNKMNQLSGQVKDDMQLYSPEIFIDADNRLIKGVCTCSFYKQNKLYQGPCAHMLALRIAMNKKNRSRLNWLN